MPKITKGWSTWIATAAAAVAAVAAALQGADLTSLTTPEFISLIAACAIAVWRTIDSRRAQAVKATPTPAPVAQDLGDTDPVALDGTVIEHPLPPGDLGPVTNETAYPVIGEDV